LHTPSRNAHKHTQVPLQRAPSTSYWHWPDPSPTFTLQVTGPPLTRAQCRSLAGPPYTCSGRHFAGWLSHPPALVVAEQLIELRLNGAPLHTPPHPSTTQDNIGLTPSSHIHKHTQVQWLLRLLALAGPSINGTPSTSRPLYTQDNGPGMTPTSHTHSRFHFSGPRTGRTSNLLNCSRCSLVPLTRAQASTSSGLAAFLMHPTSGIRTREPLTGPARTCKEPWAACHARPPPVIQYHHPPPLMCVRPKSELNQHTGPPKLE
jgi:hypothetical protein